MSGATRMIFFVNVFITDQRLSPAHYPILASQNPVHSKLDVFKYTLASYAVIPWEGAIFYIKLDTQYEQYRTALEAYIHALFPKNVKLYDYRLESYEKWIQAIALPEYNDDTWIWFICNDDHVFIDSSVETLVKLISQASQLSVKHGKQIAIFPSHWQEMMAAKKRSIYLNNKLYRKWSETDIAILEDQHDYYLTTSKSCCPIQIITKKLLKLWFSDPNRFHQNGDMRKTDGFTPPQEQITLIPYRELFRHFDAYSHSYIQHDVVPLMFIPKGFFEKKIHIQYGGNKRLPGYVYIHPEKKMISVQSAYQDRISNDFCDSNIPLDEIPLFWKDRIANVVTHDMDPDTLVKSYLAQKIREVCADPRFGYTPSQAIRKITSAFCQKYNPSFDELKIIVKTMFSAKEIIYYRYILLRHGYLRKPFSTFKGYFLFYLLTFIRLWCPSIWTKGKELKKTIYLWKNRRIQA